MHALDGWEIDRRSGPRDVAVRDPDGQVAARVRPGPAVWAPVYRLLGQRERMARIDAELWARGGVPYKGTGLVERPDGTTASLRHGAWGAPLRRCAAAGARR